MLLLLLLIICKHHYYSYFSLLHLNLALHTITHFAHLGLLLGLPAETLDRTASMNIYIHHWLTLGKKRTQGPTIKCVLQLIPYYKRTHTARYTVFKHSLHCIQSIPSHPFIHQFIEQTENVDRYYQRQTRFRDKYTKKSTASTLAFCLYRRPQNVHTYTYWYTVAYTTIYKKV